MSKSNLYSTISLFLTILTTTSFLSGVNCAATFTFVNKCTFPVWPGILSNAGITPLTPTGFLLTPTQSKTLPAPSSWGGRFWGRTHCSIDPITNKFTCLTGDCGSGNIECSGAGAAPPATLAEFTLNGGADSNLDFYDISLVDGYNLPMLVVPQGGDNCTSTGCVSDLNDGTCPQELRVMGAGAGAVACKSACEAFNTDEYCCKGTYGTPDVCKPTVYSKAFKSACPNAYSYAYDDRTSTFTCRASGYVVTFCPTPNTSKKASSGGQNPEADNPTSGVNLADSAIDGSMVYEGGSGISAASPTRSHVLGKAIAIAMVMWRLSHHYF